MEKRIGFRDNNIGRAWRRELQIKMSNITRAWEKRIREMSNIGREWKKRIRDRDEYY